MIIKILAPNESLEVVAIRAYLNWQNINIDLKLDKDLWLKEGGVLYPQSNCFCRKYESNWIS